MKTFSKKDILLNAKFLKNKIDKAKYNKARNDMTTVSKVRYLPSSNEIRLVLKNINSGELFVS